MEQTTHKEHTMTEDEKIAQYFTFLSERGFLFERDYSKGIEGHRFHLHADLPL